MVFILFDGQRAKDQIKNHVDVAAFKSFMQEECEKVVIWWIHQNCFNDIFGCGYVIDYLMQGYVFAQVEKFYLQKLAKVN